MQSSIPYVPDGVWIPRSILAIASQFAVKLYLELRRYCYESPECFPSQRRLARAVGCSVGTVNALIDQFVALGIIKKMHRGRHCLYRFGEGYWRRRQPRHTRQKPRKSADRSTNRTEDRNNFIVPVKRAPELRNPKFSQRSALVYRAPQHAERRNKRLNLIKTVRRWVETSPDLAEDEQLFRLSLLDRCEAQVDDWWGRSKEDQRAFDLLVARVRAKPLDAAIVQSLRQQPRPPDDNSIGAILASQGWYHGDRIDQSSRRGACTGQLVHSK